MPRPGRVGPGVRSAVQRASSMDALRAAEVKASDRETFGSSTPGHDLGRVHDIGAEPSAIEWHRYRAWADVSLVGSVRGGAAREASHHEHQGGTRSA